jgi:hypothetical protein
VSGGPLRVLPSLVDGAWVLRATLARDPSFSAGNLPFGIMEDRMPTAAPTAEMPLTGHEPVEEFSHLPAPEETVLRMRQAVISGRHWFDALLEAIGRWRTPEEWIGDRHFEYLVGGDAFDWMLLAERLLDEMPDLVPQAAAEAFLFQGAWPIEVEDGEFAERLGAAKYSAHLNYLYGVLVEEALQLCVEEELYKELRNRPWGVDPRQDEGMWGRVYGRSMRDLAALYYEQSGIMLGEEVTLGQWKAFTYFCFKTRLKRQDKARVASDTRKGLAQLTRMELAVSERRRGGVLGEADFAQRYTG